jgi:hypothetical protein
MNNQPGPRASGVLIGSGCFFVFGLVVSLFAAITSVTIFTAVRGSVAAGLVGLIVSLVFAAAGIALMVLAVRAPARAREQRQRRGRHPDEPWLWREDWEQGFARAEGRSQARFRMTSVPGVLGGRLRGVVETGSPADAGGELALGLSCILWTRGYRNGFSEILWHEQAKAKSSPAADGAQAPVEFDIPFDARPTETEPGNLREVFWHLTARSDGGFHALFTVPVFQTAASDRSRTRERLETQAASQLAGYSPAANRIEKVVTPEGIRYRFPRGRNRSVAAMTAVFGLIFLGIATVLFYVTGWTLGSLIGILFAGAIGLLISYMSVGLWFAETTVTAATGELRIHSSCLGISHTRVVHAEDVRGFDIKPGIQKGAEVWYDLWLKTAAGKDANAGTGMEKTEAEWFVAELRKDLGMG